MISGFQSDEILVRVERINDCQGQLSSAEKTLVTGAVALRVIEFTAGRTLAREMILQHGLEFDSLLADKNRCPVWPNGIIGSISHTRTHVAVVVAESAIVAAVGIDIEPIRSVTKDIYDDVFTEDELEVVRKSPDGRIATSIFCCKEAVYKAAFPITSNFLEFHDLAVGLSESTAEFDVNHVADRETSRLVENGRGFLDEIDGHSRAVFLVKNMDARAGVSARRGD